MTSAFTSEIINKWPDRTQLPESNGTFVKNFQEHPQSQRYNFSTAIPIKKGVNTDPAKCINFSTIPVDRKSEYS